jgi:cytidylate kinase
MIQECPLAIPEIIAIDGPAASGKSTLAKRLAECLNYLYFDTGVMYRAVTWIVIQHGAAFDDEAAVTGLAESVPIDVQPATVEDGRDNDVLVEGQDITWDIRRPEVEANVSVVSAYPGVRKALSAQQRRVGLRGRVVMVGRDIGTVVLPEAELKLYLDASVEERARRRFDERAARGNDVSYDMILGAMRRRDQIDSTRDVAPLQAAADAIVIDSDGKNLEDVVAEAMALISS